MSSNHQMPMRRMNQRKIGVMMANAAPPMRSVKVLSSMSGILLAHKIISEPETRNG